MFNFNEKELKIASIRNDVSYEELASKIGISKSSFYKCLQKSNFKLSEIYKIAEILNLTSEDIKKIFFGD